MSYDADRTRYEAPHMTTWTRVVVSTSARLGNGIEYSSALQKVAVDCTSKTWTVVRSEFFASPDGSGEAAYSYTLPREQWELRPARDGSNGAILMRILCATPKAW